jgi:hypothetical protein
MFSKAIMAALILTLTGCYQRIHTADLEKAVYVCGGVTQIAYITEHSAGDTSAKCNSMKDQVNLDMQILPKQ